MEKKGKRILLCASILCMASVVIGWSEVSNAPVVPRRDTIRVIESENKAVTEDDNGNGYREIVIVGGANNAEESKAYTDFDLEHLSIVRTADEEARENIEGDRTDVGIGEADDRSDPEHEPDDEGHIEDTDVYTRYDDGAEGDLQPDPVEDGEYGDGRGEAPDGTGDGSDFTAEPYYGEYSDDYAEDLELEDAWSDGETEWGSYSGVDGEARIGDSIEEYAPGTDEGADAEESEEGTGLTEWVYYGTCRITFYDAGACCCGEFASGYTASGEEAIVGWTVANGALDFGTMVMIDGQVYCVTDRGVDGDEFDILVSSHEEAMARGMYYADVYILG